MKNIGNHALKSIFKSKFENIHITLSKKFHPTWLFHTICLLFFTDFSTHTLIRYSRVAILRPNLSQNRQYAKSIYMANILNSRQLSPISFGPPIESFNLNFGSLESYTNPFFFSSLKNTKKTMRIHFGLKHFPTLLPAITHGSKNWRVI